MKKQKIKKVYDVIRFNPVPKNMDLSKCTDKNVLAYFNKRSVVATCGSKKLAEVIINLQGGKAFHSYEIVERTLKHK